MPVSLTREPGLRENSMWDPDDDEWQSADANYIAETFKTSCKSPAQYSPSKANALSRFGTTIHDTFSTLISLSPTKRVQDEQLRDEERLRDRIEMLANTYYYAPEGDMCDEIMKDVFLPGSRFFGYGTSPRSMHVVDLEAYFGTEDPLLQEAMPRLCDAVATILSHTNRECLDAFLDPMVKEFAYRRELDRNKAGLILVIRRKGNEVFAGAYKNFGFTLQWTLYVKSLISMTGRWHEVYAAPKLGLTRIIEGVPAWDDFEFEDAQFIKDRGRRTAKIAEGSLRKIELSSPKKKALDHNLGATDQKFVLYQSRYLAKYLLWDIWFRFEKKYECKATWEADGDVTDVRLKNTLVGFGEDSEDN